MEPLDLGDDVGRHLDRFLKFAASWATSLELNWEPEDKNPPRDIPMRNLPENVQRFVALGVRFPFLRMKFYHEWVSSDYFVLGWRVGIRMVDDTWELWNHHFNSSKPEPLRSLAAPIESALVEIGLDSLLCMPWSIEQTTYGHGRWTPEDGPKILREILDQSSLVYSNKIEDRLGFDWPTSTTEKWYWHPDGMILRHTLDLNEQNHQSLMVGVSCPENHEKLISLGCSAFRGVLAPG